MATNEEVQENAPIVMATYVRLPPPRQLTKNESLDSLDHWKSIFKSYFRFSGNFLPVIAPGIPMNPIMAFLNKME